VLNERQHKVLNRLLDTGQDGFKGGTCSCRPTSLIRAFVEVIKLVNVSNPCHIGLSIELHSSAVLADVLPDVANMRRVLGLMESFT
jgi:hypothetical protein